MAGSGIIPSIARTLPSSYYVPQADVGPEPMNITDCHAGTGCGYVLEYIGHAIGCIIQNTIYSVNNCGNFFVCL